MENESDNEHKPVVANNTVDSFAAPIAIEYDGPPSVIYGNTFEGEQDPDPDTIC